MFYTLFCFVVAMLGAYGLYSLLFRLFKPQGEEVGKVAVGIHVRAHFSEEEIEDALLLLRAQRCSDFSEPVLLVDDPLRAEVLCELNKMGAGVYLSYEEYYREKRK